MIPIRLSAQCKLTSAAAWYATKQPAVSTAISQGTTHMSKKDIAVARILEAITEQVVGQRLDDARNPSAATGRFDSAPLSEEVGHDGVYFRRNTPGPLLSKN